MRKDFVRKCQSKIMCGKVKIWNFVQTCQPYSIPSHPNLPLFFPRIPTRPAVQTLFYKDIPITFDPFAGAGPKRPMPFGVDVVIGRPSDRLLRLGRRTRTEPPDAIKSNRAELAVGASLCLTAKGYIPNRYSDTRLARRCLRGTGPCLPDARKNTSIPPPRRGPQECPSSLIYLTCFNHYYSSPSPGVCSPKYTLPLTSPVYTYSRSYLNAALPNETRNRWERRGVLVSWGP